VVGGTESRWSVREIDAQPQWPGGSRPVRLRLAAIQSAAPALSADTTLTLPLDRWLPVARSHDGVDRHELQVRVSRQP